MLGTEVDVQLVEGTVVALENFLKMWLHDQGGDREHLHLLLPPSLTSQGSTPHPANNRPSPGRNTYIDTAWASTEIFIKKSISCCTQFKMNILLNLIVCFVSLLIMFGCAMLLMLMSHSAVCLKCDMQERLLSPALLPSTPDLGMKTERMQDFQPPNKSLANQNPSPQRLQAVKYSHVCS